MLNPYMILATYLSPPIAPTLQATTLIETAGEMEGAIANSWAHDSFGDGRKATWVEELGYSLAA